MDIKNVCVIGAGIMGSGIAQLAATHGYNVNLVDVNDDILNNAKIAIEKNLERFFVAKNKISKEEAEDILNRISLGVNINEASRTPAAARDRVFRQRRIKTCPYYLLLADQPIAMMREKHHSCVLPDGNLILFEKFSKISVYNRCLKASDPFKKSKRTAGV